MPHKEVKKSIDELKTQLNQAPVETNSLEQALEHAHDGIERFTPEAVQDFTDMLQREAKEFEIEHPQITALMNQVMTALSNLGI